MTTKKYLRLIDSADIFRKVSDHIMEDTQSPPFDITTTKTRLG